MVFIFNLLNVRYRLADHTFYGPGSDFVVDSTQPVTVVTQVVISWGVLDLHNFSPSSSPRTEPTKEILWKSSAIMSRTAR